MHYTYKQTQSVLNAFESAVFAENERRSFAGISPIFGFHSSIRTSKKGISFNLKAKFGNSTAYSVSGNTWNNRLTIQKGKNYRVHFSMNDQKQALKNFASHLKAHQ
jgi:hypothetical protein